MKKKTFIIVNNVDRPWVGLVAMIVQEPKRGRIKAQYITVGTSMLDIDVDPGQMTYVEVFGIDLKFEDGKVIASCVGPSDAKYPDGSIRDWQGLPDQSIALKKEFASVFEETIKRTRCFTCGKEGDPASFFNHNCPACCQSYTGQTLMQHRYFVDGWIACASDISVNGSGLDGIDVWVSSPFDASIDIHFKTDDDTNSFTFGRVKAYAYRRNKFRDGDLCDELRIR